MWHFPCCSSGCLLLHCYSSFIFLFNSKKKKKKQKMFCCINSRIIWWVRSAQPWDRPLEVQTLPWNLKYVKEKKATTYCQPRNLKLGCSSQLSCCYFSRLVRNSFQIILKNVWRQRRSLLFFKIIHYEPGAIWGGEEGGRGDEEGEGICWWWFTLCWCGIMQQQQQRQQR